MKFTVEFLIRNPDLLANGRLPLVVQGTKHAFHTESDLNGAKISHFWAVAMGRGGNMIGGNDFESSKAACLIATIASRSIGYLLPPECMVTAKVDMLPSDLVKLF